MLRKHEKTNHINDPMTEPWLNHLAKLQTATEYFQLIKIIQLNFLVSN